MKMYKEVCAMRVYKMWFTTLLLAVFMAGCGGGNNNGGGGSTDTTAPTVSSTGAPDGATGLPINRNSTAIFSEAMDPATINSPATTFTLKEFVSGNSVPGAVTLVDATANFNPDSNLAPNTKYTSTITTAAKDLAGNALATDFVWSWETGTTADTEAPTVSSTNPANAATDVAINRKIAATFSEAMDAATITTATFTVTAPGPTPVAGTVTSAGSVATFTPASNLAVNTVFTATITTGAKDLADNALAVNKTWSFTSGATADTTAPTVSSTIPADLAPGVAINGNITATFSEAMDAATITTVNFTLTQGATPVPGAVTSPSTTTATFNPTGNLAASTTYTAAITTGVKDLAGNALAVTKTWSFTTRAATALGPQPVDLGLAGNFVILAKSGISTVPASAVAGDIGVSPIDQTAITGFSETADASNTFSTSPQVTGKIYAADYTEPTPTNLTTAVLNMQAAYTDAAGRPLPDFTELGAGEIGGLTLVPGLYKWGTGVSISTDVTLSGGPNDVWIFQIAGDLTMAAAKNVTLAGGALAKNIFWQTFGAVALDTTAHFEGVILSQTAITLNTGASVNGRLLSQTAVTLDQNAVTQPAP
jgi:hypothetical protein